MNDNKTEHDEDPETRNWLFLGGLVVFGTCLAWLILGLFIACSPAMREGWGQIGDSFGVINTMFSAAAVLGAVYAITLQQKDIKIQRDDFNQTIKEHRDNTGTQKTVAKIQAVTTQLEMCKHGIDNLYRDAAETSLIKEELLGIMAARMTHGDNIFEMKVTDIMLQDEFKMKLQIHFGIEISGVEDFSEIRKRIKRNQ